MKVNRLKGFTLLEILLVVAAIGILAGIVILAINPTKQLGQTRDAQRQVDVNTILNAVYQYSIENGGIPSTINQDTSCDGLTADNEICATGGDCTDITDLGVLTASEEYLVSMPGDPTDATEDGTGYFIIKTGNARVTVCAPGAEEATAISVTR